MKSNENKIYELLNETKINADNYELIDLSEFEEKKLMQIFQESIKNEMINESLATSQNYTGDIQCNKNFKRKKHSKKTKLVMALAIVLVIVTPLLSADFRANIQDYSRSLSAVLGIGTEGDSYKVDKILNSDNIDIKIIDIVMDDSSITMNTLFDISAMEINDSDRIEHLSIGKMKVVLNGNETYIGEASGKNLWLDKNVLNNMRTYSLKDKLKIKDDNNLKVTIEKIDCIIDGEYSAIEYNQEFELNASKEELTGGGVQSSKDVVVPSDIGDFTIKNMVFQPLMQRIEVEINSSEKTEDINLVAFVSTKNGEAKFFEHSCESAKGNESMVLLYDKENSDLSIEDLNKAKEVYLELYLRVRKSETEIEYKIISEKQVIKLK